MYLTYSQIGFFAVAMLMCGGCLGVLIMSILAMGRLGDDPLPEEPGSSGHTDQDGETFYPGHYAGQDAWKHAAAKGHHPD